jgi:hypothetical protein
MLSQRIIMTVVAQAALALAIAAYAAQAQSPQVAVEIYNRGVSLAERDFDQCLRIDPSLRSELEAVVEQARQRLGGKPKTP